MEESNTANDFQLGPPESEQFAPKSCPPWRKSFHIACGIISCYALSHLIILGMQIYSSVNSPRIKDQGQLERMVKEECRSQGVDPTMVKTRYDPRINCEGATWLMSDSTYELLINPKGEGNKLATVRHEVRHISADHFKPQIGMNPIIRFFYRDYVELSATVYQTFQIKI